MLSQALFTLHMADCRSSADDHLSIKSANKTSVTGLVEQGEAAYPGAFQELVD